MLCPDCGIPLIPVYEPTQGWVQLCARCSTFTDVISSNYHIESGQRSYLAYTKYYDGYYAEANSLFLELVDRENDLEWKIASLWGALLSHYGIDYTHFGQNYSIRFWRMDLPDCQPNQSIEWIRLYELIVSTGCRESVMPHMNAIQSHISPLPSILSNHSWKVFIDWDLTGMDSDLPGDLSEKIANKLMAGSPHIDCFFPQMQLQFQQQNYAASVYTAIKTCDIMVAVIGNKQLQDDTIFVKEIRKFWEKCNMDSAKIMLCTSRVSLLSNILPQWMIDLNWPARWNYNVGDSIDLLANHIALDIRDALNIVTTPSTTIPDLDAIYHSIIAPIKANRRTDYSWVPQAELIWKNFRDDRFGALLLGYYIQAWNKNAAQDCYSRLKSSSSKIAIQAINAPGVKSFFES